MVTIIKPKTLVLVNVRYYRPDYTHILQEFICHFDDIVPEIPRVHSFLNYWKENIEAKIKEVIVSENKTNSYQATGFYRVIH